MHSVILVAIFGFTLAVALAVASRHALLAVMFFFIGAGWPATLLSGGNELGRGIAILAVALALLAGMTRASEQAGTDRDRGGHRMRAGALEFSGGREERVPRLAALGILHAPTKAGERQYIWDARYDGVHFPKKRTTVLTIRAPHRPYYWRATILDRFDGTRWLEHVWRETPQPAPAARTAGCARPSDLVRQEVTVAALEDNHVIGEHAHLE